MRLSIKFYLSLAFVFAMLITSCQQNSSKKKPLDADSVRKSAIQEGIKSVAGSFTDQHSSTFDSSKIKGFLNKYPQLNPYAAAIDSFYLKRKYAFAWFNKGEVIEQAGNLHSRLLDLKNEGIFKNIPYIGTLDSLLNNDDLKSAPSKNELDLELMLTAQYFVFSKLAWQGTDLDVAKSVDWNLPRKKISYEQYLDSLLSKPADKPFQAPVYRQYALLQQFLVKYNQLEKRHNWPVIYADKNSYQPGDSAKTIRLVKQRLLLLEDFKGDTSSTVYTPDLKKAVLQFQERHGLPASGILNKVTITQLNVPLKKRIRQIIVNMERSRWLPVTLQSDYLGVNIPEFKLHVYHADSLLWSCNVVVGQQVHKTIVFSGDMQYIVFSPYWNIPPGILTREILPGMKRDPNYLRKHNMEQNGYSGNLPVIRQKPGPANSLGQVKFLFPNSYNIYLHDTPSKMLFKESRRDFSHGCIRVAEPAKLAGFVLKDNPGWTQEKIVQAMQKGKEQYVTLKKKLPVYIAYFTAFTDRNNNLNFRNDIYQRDDQLAEMLIAANK